MGSIAMDLVYSKFSHFSGEELFKKTVDMPGLNKGNMSVAALQLCALAATDGWREWLSSYDSNRIGLYSSVYDNYGTHDFIYNNWEMGKDLRTFFRGNMSPSFGFKKNGSLTTAHLSILLKICGPSYSLMSESQQIQFAFDIAMADFTDKCIDLAVMCCSFTRDNIKEQQEAAYSGAVLMAFNYEQLIKNQKILFEYKDQNSKMHWYDFLILLQGKNHG